MRSTSTNNDFEIVVITAEGSVSDEALTCNALLEAGLSKLHIRKPGTSAADLKALIRGIQRQFWKRIIVHEHHELVEEMNLGGYHIKSKGKTPAIVRNKHVSKSFHSFDEVRSCDLDLNYGFVSPVFDSISKKGYSSNFTMETLKDFLSGQFRFPVFALGGVSADNLPMVRKMGFDGAATIGSIWTQASCSERVRQFQSMKGIS